MSDQVDNPKHYEVMPGIEAINIIEAVMTAEEFRGYCKGCAMKYLMRANKKHDDQGSAIHENISKDVLAKYIGRLTVELARATNKMLSIEPE